MFIGDDGLGHGAIDKKADRRTLEEIANSLEMDSLGDHIVNAIERLIEYKLRIAFEEYEEYRKKELKDE